MWARLTARSKSVPEHGPVPTPQQIADYDEMRKLKRERLTLYQRPLETLSLFFSAACYVITRYAFLSSIKYNDNNINNKNNTCTQSLTIHTPCK